MPNLLPAPITKEHLVNYLEGTSDFQFEMEVFRCCLNHRFHSKHAGTYTDPVTGIDRLFDIRAIYTNTVYAGLTTSLKLAVECKNLRPNFPLLVSCVPRLREEGYHHAILNGVKRSRVHAASMNFDVVTHRIAYETLRFDYTNGSLFLPGESVGKATAQVGRTGDGTKEGWKFSCNDDEVYEGWSQAVSSAYELILDAYTECSTTNASPVASVILPILVVPDGLLWAVEYGSNGARKREPTLVNHCTFYLGKNFPKLIPIKDYRISHLLIFTKTGFDQYLTDLLTPAPNCNSSGLWDRLFPDLEIKDAITKLSVMPPTENGITQEYRPASP